MVALLILNKNCPIGTVNVEFVTLRTSQVVSIKGLTGALFSIKLLFFFLLISSVNSAYNCTEKEYVGSKRVLSVVSLVMMLDFYMM